MDWKDISERVEKWRGNNKMLKYCDPGKAEGLFKSLVSVKPLLVLL